MVAMRAVALSSVAIAFVLVACGSSQSPGGFTSQDGSVGSPDGGGPGNDGGANPNDATFGGGDAPSPCNPLGQDHTGCSCPSSGAVVACYPASADPKTVNVGTCHRGSQTCVQQGEFLVWGPCTGAVTPTSEDCAGTTDSNCNGKVGCADPTCASNPACNTGCTDGQTRSCYDGPQGTENVGSCKDGTQTCAGGAWPTTCTGEVLPTTENCCDNGDHNCNGFAGCFDLFSGCATAQCCQTQCQSPLDPGCVCPQGSGDQMTCPQGDHDVHNGGFPGTDECCPCTDCSDINCCGNSVCSGSSTCSGLTCNTLPASCNGQVDSDCDDFPEDCDEPCCLCSQCP
jgi:hypothetical protein